MEKRSTAAQCMQTSTINSEGGRARTCFVSAAVVSHKPGGENAIHIVGKLGFICPINRSSLRRGHNGGLGDLISINIY